METEVRHTVARAAARLGVSEKTVRRMIERGEITTQRIGLHKLFIPESGLRAYEESHTRQAAVVT